MVRKRISRKRQRYLEKSTPRRANPMAGLTRINPLEELVNPEHTALAILEFLQNNDPEGAMEMIAIYLSALDKAKLRKSSDLPKSTMYSALKHRNPTIKTLAKIMHTSTHKK